MLCFKVFRKARNKAKEEVNKQLEEFCTTRTAGLGSMFGPPDSQLEESLHNKAKELQIVETYLVPRVEHFK
jgi:Rho guanine nucleotide exchange factor 12